MRNTVLCLVLTAMTAGCVQETAPVTSAPSRASSVHVAMFDGQVTVSTADGSHAFSRAEICGYGYIYVAKGAPRLTLDRSGQFLTVAGVKTDVACGPMGGGGRTAGYSGGETQAESQAESGETDPGETTGGSTQGGTTDSGGDAGFGAISG